MTAAAEQLASVLPPRAVIWLDGPLGAGKTTFTRAAVRARGGGEVATSPTYALVHRYEGSRGPIHHVDCFRLRSHDDAADLDWETLMQSDLLLIEWPGRAGAWAPEATVHVRLEHDGPNHRAMSVTP